jgi:ubiquinone/menaquinone biosynthesis C-methylase UbiE
MIRLSERQKKQTKLQIDSRSSEGTIPLGDGTVDTVVSTFTLCRIPGVAEAFKGLRRVLRPSGKVIFLEHALSLDPNVRRWQEWWQPIHHWVFEGLQLTGDTPASY